MAGLERSNVSSKSQQVSRKGWSRQVAARLRAVAKNAQRAKESLAQAHRVDEAKLRKRVTK